MERTKGPSTDSEGQLGIQNEVCQRPRVNAYREFRRLIDELVDFFG